MISIPEFLTTAPPHLFFTGKGGVGKTSLGCVIWVDVQGFKVRPISLTRSDRAYERAHELALDLRRDGINVNVLADEEIAGVLDAIDARRLHLDGTKAGLC